MHLMIMAREDEIPADVMLRGTVELIEDRN